MKLFWLFVVFVAFVTTTSTAFAESGTIIKITNTPTHSTSPSIAVSGPDIYLVWTENSKDGSFDMFFSKSNDGGDSFSDPKKIVNQKGNTLSPMIASNEKPFFFLGPIGIQTVIQGVSPMTILKFSLQRVMMVEIRSANLALSVTRKPFPPSQRSQ